MIPFIADADDCDKRNITHFRQTSFVKNVQLVCHGVGGTMPARVTGAEGSPWLWGDVLGNGSKNLQ